MRWGFVRCLSFWQVCSLYLCLCVTVGFILMLNCAYPPSHLPHTHIHTRTMSTSPLSSGGCFRYWRWVCLVWTRTPCTPSCWTSAQLTVTAGSMWTASGFPLANPNPTVTAVCTFTPTLRTLVPTGWRLRCPSVKSNWPTNSMEVDRCCKYTLPLVYLYVSSFVMVYT